MPLMPWLMAVHPFWPSNAALILAEIGAIHLGGLVAVLLFVRPSVWPGVFVRERFNSMCPAVRPGRRPSMRLGAVGGSEHGSRSIHSFIYRKQGR